jgi:hypothetical protein
MKMQIGPQQQVDADGVPVQAQPGLGGIASAVAGGGGLEGIMSMVGPLLSMFGGGGNNNANQAANNEASSQQTASSQAERRRRRGPEFEE